MPDFIYARGTFYPITFENEAEYLCDSEEETYSFLKEDHPDVVEVDGVKICNQAGDAFVARESFVSGLTLRCDTSFDFYAYPFNGYRES